MNSFLQISALRQTFFQTALDFIGNRFELCFDPTAALRLFVGRQKLKPNRFPRQEVGAPGLAGVYSGPYPRYRAPPGVRWRGVSSPPGPAAAPPSPPRDSAGGFGRCWATLGWGSGGGGSGRVAGARPVPTSPPRPWQAPDKHPGLSGQQSSYLRSVTSQRCLGPYPTGREGCSAW